MLVAVHDSHGFSSAFADSVFSLPQSPGLQGSPSISVFDLLLSQIIAPAFQANPAVPNQKTEPTDVVSVLPESNRTISHLSKQKSMLPGDSATTNPLTNTLFVATGLNLPKEPTAATYVSGIRSQRGNSKDPMAESGRAVSTATTFPSGKQGLIHSQGSQSTVHSAKGTGGHPADAVDSEINPVASDPAAPAKSQNQQGPVAFPVIPEANLSTGTPTKSRNPDQKPAESTLGLSESSPPIPAIESNLPGKSIESGFNSAFASVSVETTTTGTNPTHVVEPARRPAVVNQDANISPGATLTASPVEHTVDKESAVPWSSQLATAITQNIAHVPSDGTTTVRIRLQIQDLGSINLHLSVSKNILSVRIITDNQQSQRLVESQISALRQTLSVSGIECGQLEVASVENQRQFTNQKALTPAARSTDIASTTRGSASTTLKYPVSSRNYRVSFVA